MSKSMIVSRSTRAFVAAALAVGLMLPTTAAFADDGTANQYATQFTMTNVAVGDTVTAYRIFSTSIDEHNSLVDTMDPGLIGLPEAYDTPDEIRAAGDGKTLADAIAATVIGSNCAKVNGKAEGSTQVALALDPGYYLVVVTSTGGNTRVYQRHLVDATPSINDQGVYVAHESQSAETKAENVEKPSKSIVTGSDPDTAVKDTDMYSVGDKVKFRIAGTIPSYPADATKATYAIVDKPDTGLTVDTDPSNFVVKVKDGEQYTKLNIVTDYTLDLDAQKGTYTVNFTNAFIMSHLGSSVTVEYEATVNKIDSASGVIGNNAFAKFNPNPYFDGSSDTDSDRSTDQTYGFSFKKLGASGSDAPAQALKGAEFTVTDANGNAVTYIDAEGKLHKDGKVVSDDAGWVYVNGLKAGTYTVTETKAPSGYQKVDSFEVVLSNETANGNTDATASITETNFANAGEKTDPKVGQLPTTGGSGTIMLTAGGVLLIVGGSAVALRSIKRNRKQN